MVLDTIKIKAFLFGSLNLLKNQEIYDTLICVGGCICSYKYSVKVEPAKISHPIIRPDGAGYILKTTTYKM